VTKVAAGEGLCVSASRINPTKMNNSNITVSHAGATRTSLIECFKKNPRRLLWLLLLPLFLIWFAWFKSNWSKNTKIVVSVLSLILLIIIFATDSPKPEPQPLNPSQLYKVITVIDGDTIDVDINGKTERLRLIGIDTPETKDPRKPVQCFGKEASDQAHKLLDGKRVRIESDHTQDNRDKYDRLLRYVFIEDGTFYNKQIVLDGYAHEYTYNAPYKYQSEFKQAQKEAETAMRGLWSPSTCNGDTEQTAEQPVQTPPAAVIPATPPATVAPTTPTTDVYYQNCTAAREADAAPLYEGEAGYRSALDRDSDGIACE